MKKEYYSNYIKAFRSIVNDIRLESINTNYNSVTNTNIAVFYGALFSKKKTQVDSLFDHYLYRVPSRISKKRDWVKHYLYEYWPTNGKPHTLSFLTK